MGTLPSAAAQAAMTDAAASASLQHGGGWVSRGSVPELWGSDLHFRFHCKSHSIPSIMAEAVTKANLDLREEDADPIPSIAGRASF